MGNQYVYFYYGIAPGVSKAMLSAIIRLFVTSIVAIIFSQYIQEILKQSETCLYLKM